MIVLGLCGAGQNAVQLNRIRSPDAPVALNLSVAVVVEAVVLFCEIVVASVVASVAKQAQSFGAVVAKVRMTVPEAQAPLSLKDPAVLPPTCVLIAHEPEFVGVPFPTTIKAGALRERHRRKTMSVVQDPSTVESQSIQGKPN